MPQMTNSQNIVVDPVLTNVAQGFRHPMNVGHMLFPEVPVQVSQGRIVVFGKESFKRYNTRRAPGANAKRIRFGHDGAPFVLDNHALDAVVPREHMRDASVQPGIDLASRAVLSNRRIHALELELEQADLARDAAQYDANHKLALSGSDVWSHADSTPIADIQIGREAVRASCGMYPNVLLLSAKAFTHLSNHASVVDRYKHTTSNVITAEMLAALFEVDHVVIGKAVTAADDETFSDAWGTDAVLAYTEIGSIDNEAPSYGYTYTMEGHPLVEVPYWDSGARSWVYGVSYERKPVMSGMTAGFLFQGAGD